MNWSGGLVPSIHLTHLECMLSTTVQALNVCSLDKIYEYLSEFKFVVKAPNLVNLHFPYYFATTVLPPALKKIASINLLEVKHNYSKLLPEHYKYLVNNINNIINFMNSENVSRNDHFEEFKRFQKEFDFKRGFDLLSYCPEFKKFI